MVHNALLHPMLMCKVLMVSRPRALMKTPQSTSRISFWVWRSLGGRRSRNAENAHGRSVHLLQYYFLISLAGKSQFISSMEQQLSAITWRAITRSRFFSLADLLIHFRIQADYLTWLNATISNQSC